jgi:amidohydrolase
LNIFATILINIHKSVVLEGEKMNKNEFESRISEIRRDLHRIPEPAYKEFKTSQYIYDALVALEGAEVEKGIAETGVSAYFKGKEGKRTIAFRCDIDALSIPEMNDIDFKSEHEGFMHACGHDSHMTIALGLAMKVSQMKEKLSDNILIFFQPAEEGPGGAKPMIEEGLLKKYSVDQIYGLHVFPEIEEGKIATRKGPLMAMAGEIDIEIITKSGHGAMPHLGNDGVIVASQLINQLQTIVSRNVNPLSEAVLTFGKIYGGDRRNIIADKVILEGTVRAFDEEVYDKVKRRFHDICEGVARSFNAEIKIDYRDLYPPVMNDGKLYEEFKDILGDAVVDIDPLMISEDFSYYQKEVPGLFVLLGSRSEEKGYVYPLHNSKFNFDEKILTFAIDSFINLLEQKDVFK